MDSIQEILYTPHTNTCDVCVCGGGVAGIAAALAAARQGRRVILLDRGYMLGGLATAGIVTIYLPLCDGMGHQVSFGIAEELLRLSIRYGHEPHHPYPAAWLEGGAEEDRCTRRYEVGFNAQLFAIAAEQLLLEHNVEILYGASLVNTIVKDGRITHVVIEGKTGREAIEVKAVVDATGDADVAKLAGATTADFQGGNLLAAWYYSYGGGKYALHMQGFCDISDEEKKQGKTVDVLSSRRFAGLTTKELSEQMILSHESLLRDVLRRRETTPDLLPVTMATIPQVRMTRRLVGAYTMDVGQMHMHFSDSVGMFSDWRKRGPVYELPFSTLWGREVKNLVIAGRCISVTDALWDVTRVIPVCAVSGEAAGIAASMTDDFSQIDIRRLQTILLQNGVKLHENEIP